MLYSQKTGPSSLEPAAHVASSYLTVEFLAPGGFDIQNPETGPLPDRPDGVPADVTTVPAEAAPAVAVSGEGEPTGVDGFEGKLLLVWSGE